MPVLSHLPFSSLGRLPVLVYDESTPNPPLFQHHRRLHALKNSFLSVSAAMLALALAASLTFAQETPNRQRPGGGEPRATPGETTPSPTAEGSLPIPPETKSETKHDWTAGGHTVHYTATAGNLLIRDDDDKPNGSIFYVAYTEDGATRQPPRHLPLQRRPRLRHHLAAHGLGRPHPRRHQQPRSHRPRALRVGAERVQPLDKTDLVFIDAPLCGFSRAVGKGTAKDFAGVDQDVNAFENFITRYITVNQRWNSPKFLFGESYGTPRSAALVAALNNDGIEFNGVTLLSSILNYYVRSPGYDLDADHLSAQLRRHRLALQQGAAHRRHDGLRRAGPQVRPRPLRSKPSSRATASRQPSSTPSPPSSPASPASASHYVKESKLRIQPTRFRKELLRGDEQILGRYDARFEGFDVDAVGETPGYDPSDTGISGAFVGAFHDYLAHRAQVHQLRALLPARPRPQPELGLAPPSLRRARLRRRRQADQPDTVIDLADAMRKNPHLKVFSANGWFDLATPFFGTEHDLAQMMLPAAIQVQRQLRLLPRRPHGLPQRRRAEGNARRSRKVVRLR